jgi:glycosyltransferase involved in cell wall biosynthesis
MSGLHTSTREGLAESGERQIRGFVSIVVPCLNEELVVGEFVDWCWEGLRKAGADGEVIIVDSSTDRSPEIAEAHGARVLRVPKLGLGRAYIDAIPHIKGDYVIMGDCDLTYDFRELGPFIEELESGAEFVMGSRFKGFIEPDAMPRLHQYFGTPLTTWILNRIYGTHFSDIHCGMRAIRIDALKKIRLQSQGWEYASEMILKAVRLKLKTAEVPVRFYRDRDGRESHHKRVGWYSPWVAGWDNLKVMMLYAPEVFLVAPGVVLLALGLILSLALVGGPIHLGDLGLDLHWMLLGVTLSTIGYSSVQVGVLARIGTDLYPEFRERVMRLVSFNRGALAALALALAGVGINIGLIVDWVSSGLKLKSISHPGVFGLLLVLLGFQTFAFTLLLQIFAARSPRQ